MEYGRRLFFGVSRDLILQLGEGIGLPENCVRFDARMRWIIRQIFEIFGEILYLKVSKCDVF